MARDADALFAALARSGFRSRFRLNPADAAYLQAKGMDTVAEHAARFVAERLAPAEPRNDGKQTPMRGHPAFVAQHATATCCRACLAKWHGIPQHRVLSPGEQQQIVTVLRRWLTAQGGDTIPC